MKKSIYKWHRILSLIIAIPVLLWAASGFMHPIMTNIRPSIRQQVLQPVALDHTKIKQPFSEALMQNGIVKFHDVRIVHFDTLWFYQVQLDVKSIPVYLSCNDGKQLKNGDELYARHLAKQFLEGQSPTDVKLDEQYFVPVSQHDCCDAAARMVLADTVGADVNSVQRVKAFNDEYGEVNKILPVYKVAFERNDKIRVYVETIQDRFVYAVDDKRARFDAIFGMFHSWEWGNGLGSSKQYLIILLMLIALFTSGMGLYLFFTTKSVKPRGNSRLMWRYRHRWVSVCASLFTIMFAFSGAYHAWSKTFPDDRYSFYDDQIILVSNLKMDPLSMARDSNMSLSNISVIAMHDTLFWRLYPYVKNAIQNSSKQKPWDKGRTVEISSPRYIQDENGETLLNGEKRYAAYLAQHFQGNENGSFSTILPVTKFDGEYAFVNKRLPVWKVVADGQQSERFYIETSTGTLAARVDDNDLPEGYSFSFLHKHHFMDFTGKVGRDLSTMFWAAMQIVMVVVGIFFWINKTRAR